MRRQVIAALLAGLVAGVMAVSVSRAGEQPLPAAAAEGGHVPRREHFAFLNVYEYLDGPRLEAMSGKSPNISWDDEGNMYFFSTLWYGAIRCIRTDGRVVTISGNDYWMPVLPLTEGPASALPHPAGGTAKNYSYPSGGIAVQGMPDQGADKGCIYVAAASGGVDRVFRNKDHGGRWWFQRIMGTGKAPVPRKRGTSVAAMDVALGWVSRLEIGRNGKLQVFAKGSFLEYENGQLVCLLGPDDYLGKGGEGPKAPCSEGYLGSDGSFYLGTYYDGEGYGGKGTAIYRVMVSSDGIKVEPLAKSQRGVQGGDAMTEAGWHCGPHLAAGWNEARYQPPGVLLTSSHDEAALRRIMDGRSAMLCNDGEWRELVGNRNRNTPLWFHMWRIGPNGTGYQIYSGGDWFSDQRLYRITGIDYARPTVR